MELIFSLGFDYVFEYSTANNSSLNSQSETRPTKRVWLLFEFLFASSLQKTTLKQTQQKKSSPQLLSTVNTMTTTEDWVEFVDNVRDWCQKNLYPYLKMQTKNINEDFIKLCFQKSLSEGGIYAHILSLVLTERTAPSNVAMTTHLTIPHIIGSESDSKTETLHKQLSINASENVLQHSWLSTHADQLVLDYLTSHSEGNSHEHYKKQLVSIFTVGEIDLWF
jgi:hypothetical protein